MDTSKSLFLFLSLAGMILNGISDYPWAQTPKKRPSEPKPEFPHSGEPAKQGETQRWLKIHEEMVEGGPKEGSSTGDRGGMMRKMMEEFGAPKAVPFYQEKTFLAMVVAAFVILIAVVIKRWGLRPWRALKKPTAFLNEAILVVDLCESTRAPETGT